MQRKNSPLFDYGMGCFNGNAKQKYETHIVFERLYTAWSNTSSLSSCQTEMPRIIEAQSGILFFFCFMNIGRKRLTFDDYMESITVLETKRLTSDANGHEQSSELETASESDASVQFPNFFSHSLCYTVCGTNEKCLLLLRSYFSPRSTIPFITPHQLHRLLTSLQFMFMVWLLIVLM